MGIQEKFMRTDSDAALAQELLEDMNPVHQRQTVKSESEGDGSMSQDEEDNQGAEISPMRRKNANVALDAVSLALSGNEPPELKPLREVPPRTLKPGIIHSDAAGRQVLHYNDPCTQKVKAGCGEVILNAGSMKDPQRGKYEETVCNGHYFCFEGE